MRGLHGNRPFDRDRDRQGRGRREQGPGRGSVDAERDAATARLLALGSQLNGIRDNLTQVLASSHLMIQAAGDIDLELDVSIWLASWGGSIHTGSLHASALLTRHRTTPM